MSGCWRPRGWPALWARARLRPRWQMWGRGRLGGGGWAAPHLWPPGGRAGELPAPDQGGRRAVRGRAVPQAAGALLPAPLEAAWPGLDFHRILPLSPRTGKRPQARGPGTDFSHVSYGAAVTGEFRQCHPRLPSAHQGWTWPRREGSRPRAGQSPAGGGCSGCEGVSWGGRGPVACRSHAAGARVERGPGEGCTARSCPYREEGRGQHRPVLPRPSRRPCPGTGALLARLCGREGRQGGRVALSARAGCAVRWATPCPAGRARTCSASDHESSSQRWEGADPLGAAGPGQCVRAAPREDAPLQKARSPRGPGETEAPLGRSQLVQTPPAVPEAASAPMGLRCRGPSRRCGPRAVGAARHRGSICKARETAWALERETPGDTGGGPARTVCSAHRHT